MRAAVLTAIAELEMKNLPRPKCDDGDVLIRVAACGICRTDMKAYTQGQRDLTLPRILGHEITGIVEETGGGVEHLQVGDRVQVAPGLACGLCAYCCKGLDNMCAAVKIMGFDYDGGFAEYVLVPATGVRNGVVNRIPEHVTFEEAVFTEPLACSINMQDAIQIGPGESVVIFGAGPLGILNARLAKARGASVVILVEQHEERKALYAEKGFDYCLPALHGDPVKAVLEITGGLGADAVIPCCPAESVIGQGLTMLSKRGRFGFFSGLLCSGQLQADFNEIHYKELTVRGAYGCSANHNQTALRFISSDLLTVSDLVSRRIPLEEVTEGIRAVKNLEESKIVVNP